jgi:hypothetical protein
MKNSKECGLSGPTEPKVQKAAQPEKVICLFLIHKSIWLRSTYKQKDVRRTSSEQYVIVEEEICSEHERTYKSPLRIHDSNIGRQSLPSEVTYQRIQKSPLCSRQEKHNFTVPIDCETTTSRRSIRLERSPSPIYRYVEPPTQHRSTAQQEGKQSRRIRRPSLEGKVHERVAWFRGSNHNISVSPIQDKFGQDDNSRTVSSSHPRDSRRRRRRERLQLESKPIHPREQPHVIYSQNTDGPIVVTDHFVYQPRSTRADEGSRRQQEYLDRAAFNKANHTTSVSTEEASRYYHEDWSGIGLSQDIEGYVQRNPVQRGRYRRNSYQDAELADSESTQYVRFCMYTR